MFGDDPTARQPRVSDKQAPPTLPGWISAHRCLSSVFKQKGVVKCRVNYVNLFQERMNRTGIQNNHPTFPRKVDTGFRELRAETFCFTFPCSGILIIFES